MKKVSGAAINALKEALVNIYWYKSDLTSFLKASLTSPDILSRIDQDTYKRNIVSILIDHLVLHEDIYQGDLLRLMVETAKLDDFSHLKRLEDGEIKAQKAKSAVGALKKWVSSYQNEIEREEKTEEKRKIAYEESLKNKAVREKVDELKNLYFALLNESPQQRGYILEKILRELFEVFDLDPKASFKVIGEQIDGAFTFDSTDYLLEAKWQNEQVNASELDAFKGKLSRKLDNTLGLFLAINGYSEDAVKLHSTGRGMAILADGSDLMAVLEGRIDLLQLLLRKRRHAAQTGNIYLKIHEILA